MNKFWSLFWKLFGAALLIVLFIGCMLGIIQHSVTIVYETFQMTMAVGMGVCGIIGIVVIPIELYVEDRIQKGECDAA
jgi:hypothetical protein